MKIVANERFLDGRNEYLKDKEYSVPNDKGYYFCHMGWARKEGEPEILELDQPSETSLDIQDVEHKTKSRWRSRG